MRDAVLAVSILSGVLLACARPPPRQPLGETLRSRVVAELACPPEDVIVTPLPAGAYAVLACGRRATFSCVREERYPRSRTYDLYDFRDQCVREGPWSE